jgi:two-component system cell cycle response regulator
MNTSSSILIVEDDDFLRTLAYNKLTSSGFSVDAATNGQMGLEKISEQKHDIVILDLLLPIMDGFQVLKELHDKKLLQNQRIIVFSNLGSESDIKQVIEFGVKHYMIKSSFTLDELVIKINEVLAEPLSKK